MANVLFVSNSSKPGGMEKHILDLVVGMSKYGHQVFVWCPEGSFLDEYIKAGAKVTCRQILSDIDLGYIRDLAYFIRQNDINVVHGHELKAGSNALIASWLAQVKFRFTHTHTPISTWVAPVWKKVPSYLGYSLLVNLLATKEVALTPSVAQIKIRELIRPSKLVVIPNGVDFDRFQVSEIERGCFRDEVRRRYGIKKDHFVVGNVSRLTAEKGYDVLIQAVSMLTSKDVFLLMCGGGEREEKLNKQAKEASISYAITGVYTPSEHIKLLSALDLLVFPSLTEGFGYVALEGLAFGLPVLASDIKVIRQSCGDHVSYFKVGEPLDLSRKIDWMRENWNEVVEKVSEGKRYVEETYSMERFWESYNKLYTKGAL